MSTPSTPTRQIRSGNSPTPSAPIKSRLSLDSEPFYPSTPTHQIRSGTPPTPSAPLRPARPLLNLTFEQSWAQVLNPK